MPIPAHLKSHLTVNKRVLVGGRLRNIELNHLGSPVRYMKRWGRPVNIPFSDHRHSHSHHPTDKSGTGFLSGVLGSFGLGMQKAEPGTIGSRILTALEGQSNLPLPVKRRGRKLR